MEPTQGSPQTKARFNPAELGEFIRHERDGEGNHQPFVTFLLGAGCSKSAGIPLAGEIVKELRDEVKTNPFLRNVGDPPTGTSEYAFLMEKLGCPWERAKRVKRYVDRARDPQGRIRINWTYLLLAAMVEKGYINRILTTNFDPLVVEALAVMGQPIRTFDLNTTGKYHPGTLDPASIIYLHGQMHNLLLANSPDEMDRLKGLYPSVLQEAVQDSLLIVIGYSGDCDPVLEALTGLPNLPRGLWWSHYGGQLGEGVQRLFQRHGTDCHLAEGDDADTFMRKLVLEGMKLDLPDEVLTPIQAMRSELERITPFPTKDFQGGDPLGTALEQLRYAEGKVSELTKAMPIEMAVLSGDWDTFDQLIQGVQPDPSSRHSQAIGDGLLKRASQLLDQEDPQAAISWLHKSDVYGLKAGNQSWLLTIWGCALSDQANLKGDTPEADQLFAEAGHRFAEAVRFKPDMHEALNNWGIALSDQAKLKGNTPEADRLYAEAGQKYAEAVRIKPDKHEAYNNWGNALSDQARLKGNKPEADQLFAEAGQRYAEAVRIKPDMHDALYNWGIALSDQAKLKGDTPEADQLFAEAGQRFAEVVRIKPDMHETYYNWGIALSDQAKLKGDTQEADQLYAKAGQRYAEAVRIKPDTHKAFYNWGNALLAQVRLKENTPEADRLFTEANQKYAEAVRIKPDKHEAYFNLACLFALRGDLTGAIDQLELCVKYKLGISKAKLDNDPDFDRIRNAPEFLGLRDRLPG